MYICMYVSEKDVVVSTYVRREAYRIRHTNIPF